MANAVTRQRLLTCPHKNTYNTHLFCVALTVCIHSWALVFSYKYCTQHQPFIIVQHNSCVCFYLCYNMTRRLVFDVLSPKVLNHTHTQTHTHIYYYYYANYCGKLSIPLNAVQPNFMWRLQLQVVEFTTFFFVFLLQLHDGKSC